MKVVITDGGRRKAGYTCKQAGDCVCRAITIASGLPYQQVYDVLAEGNATQRKTRRSHRSCGVRSAMHGISTKRKWFHDYMTSLGFEWTPTMFVGQGCQVHLRDGELPMGKLVVSVSKHMCAVIDGVIYDSHDPSRDGTRCVYGYYRLGRAAK
jgi:hypothetical protein